MSYSYRSETRAFTLYLDFINLFDHKNVYNLTWEKALETGPPSSTEAVKRRTIYMLPFLPSLGVQLAL